MKRNIILLSITIVFAISLSLVKTFVLSDKPDEILDLEDLQKTANEKYITAQILSQSLDNVYKLFEINLATKKNDERNKEASVVFINKLTDIFHKLKINVIEIRPMSKQQKGKYTHVPYEVTLSCDYEKFGKLVSELERNERLINIDKFDFNNSPENVRRKKDLKELPDAIVTMQISTITLNKSRK